MKKKPKKLALWARVFTDQHAKLTKPASDHQAARLQSAKERRSLAKAGRRIRPRTTSRAAQERQYRAEVKEWLKLPENAVCAVWSMSAEFANTCWTSEPLVATQCHHIRGRRGALLLDKRYWAAVSDVGHKWIHANPHKAAALGLLCERGGWNSIAT
jgi:hypothetical protein